MSRSLASDVRRALRRLQRWAAGIPGWLAGIAVGVQSALLSLLVVLAPATAAAATAPSPDGSAQVDWAAAAGIAAKIWLLAHGVPIETEQATFGLIPLGLTLVTGAILVAVARQFAAKAWGSWFWAVAAYATCVVVVTFINWASLDSVIVLSIRGAVGGVLLAAPCVAWGIWRAHGADFGWLSQIPLWVRSGLRLGLGTVAASLLAAAVVSTWWAIKGATAIGGAATGLGVDAVGGVALAATETMYAPTMVVWMLGWLTGIGFSVGEGNVFAPSVVATDQLPAIPILGALPHAGGGVWVWSPLVLVALGALAWLLLRGRLGHGKGAMGATAVGVAAFATSLLLLLLLTSGAAGPGQLLTVGAPVLPVTLVGTALVTAGYLVAALLSAGWDWGWGAWRGRDSKATGASLLDRVLGEPTN